VSKTHAKNFVSVVLANMGWPVSLGAVGCAGFYALVHQHVIESPLVTRYFTGHPVLYAETALFWVGLAALALKALNVVGQFGNFGDIEVVARPEGGQALADVTGMLNSVDQLPRFLRDGYLARRLREVLVYIQRKGSADGLDRELKHLAELDATRQHDGFALVRIIIWATPMLGFLGTVIGITMALADLSPEALVRSPETAMQGLLAGLGVAFDTTALALTLSIVLMFSQYLVSQLESELLAAVDRRIEAEMVGRFQEYGTDRDPLLASAQRITEALVGSVEQLVERQAAIWHESLQSVSDQWKQAASAAGSKLESAMGNELQRSIRDHTLELAKYEEEAAQRVEEHWHQLHRAILENARVMRDQQAELVRQGDILLKTVDAATGLEVPRAVRLYEERSRRRTA
jgi:biopolymer transport protein ExbB/TolQ